MGAKDHREQASEIVARVAVVTVSDTRTPETDVNRTYLEQALADAGHEMAAYRLIRDEPDQVAAVLDELAGMSAVDVVLFNGGTGISPRDTTYDVVSRKLEKELMGFGELFRMLSWHEVGAAAMLSRATAGIYRGVVVFSVPGSPNAVKTAVEKLILPEIRHLVWEISR